MERRAALYAMRGGRVLRLAIAMTWAMMTGASAQAPVEQPVPDERIQSPGGSLTLLVQHEARAWSLLEGDRSRTRWRRDWRTMDRMPAYPSIHDSGWIVATTWPTEQVVIEPTEGRTVLTFNVLKQLPRGEYARYVNDTVMDSPPHWGGSHSLRGFRDVGEDPYYCIRAWWGRRVIVDLKRASFVEDEGAIHDACVTAEHETVLKTLREAVENPFEPDTARFFRVRRAAHLAGCMDIGDALPLLEIIEIWDHTNGTAGRGGGPPILWRDNSLRRYVQLSIRRLGGTPQPLPSFCFPAQGELPAPLLQSSAERAGSAAKVRVGMTGHEVVALIGAPDAMPYNPKYHREDWEYDFDVQEPFTLRVAWDGQKVAEVETVRPARWKQGTKRDEQLLAGEP